MTHFVNWTTFFSVHFCIIGSRDIKEMQISEEDGEEREFVSSDGA